MNYQVGNTCYENKSQAENVYFSKVVPVISSDGQLNQVLFDGNKWTYQGKEIHAYLPQCDIQQNFKDGMYVGSLVMLIMISVWSIRLMIKIIERYR